MNKDLEDKELSLGERLRHIRLAKGMTQKDVAEGICTKSAISQIEGGQIENPTLALLEKIAKKLGISVADLTSIDHVPPSLQLEKIELFVQRKEYTIALEFIEQLKNNSALEFIHKREFIFLQAECLMKTGRAKEAIRLLEDFEEQIKIFSPEGEREFFQAKLFNKIGNAYFLSFDLVNAYQNYLQAYEHHLFERDLLKGQIEYNLGYVASLMGNDMQAISYYASAQRIYSGIETVDVRYLGDVFYSLGNACFNAGHHQRAATYYRQAQSIYDSAKHVRLGLRVRVAHADRILAKEDQKEADRILGQCCIDLAKIGDNHGAILAYATHANLAMDTGDYDTAHKRLQMVYQKFTNELETEDPRNANFYRSFARYHLLTDSYDLCIRYATTGANMFQKIGLLRESALSLELAMDAYEKQGKITKAFELSRQIIELQKRAEEGIR